MSYELKAGKAGQFFFNLKATNGRVILTSESYKTKASALAGIESVRANGSDDGRFESKTSTGGDPYFVLKSANGQVLGRSEMYSDVRAKDTGIASVKKNSASTTVKDLTEA